ncbi:YeeE/YedE family integral membrane protein [Lineolata rhizophorae]|uniref:YeeE/YedE family integral membrane protein n=1 Tax=Lineolata rhizophorae TaxID=578093 RepID=A0A6A6P927_9PEZI|nr:YeeE/YedE family integral membrane protein [Lineolata rhizophorae]
MLTPVETTLGSLLAHQAATNLLFDNGAILGISGLLRGLMSAPSRNNFFFFTGMALSWVPLKLLAPQVLPVYPDWGGGLKSILWTATMGALVGWGTKCSNGCTSGHMLCGLSRLSSRSLVAVGTFFPTALITRHVFSALNPSLVTSTASVCPIDAPCYAPVYPDTSTTATLVGLTTTAIVLNRYLPPLAARKHSTEAGRATAWLTAGTTFGLGLLLSGMASPAKVSAFFDVLSPSSLLPSIDLSAWDPSLALILLFGVVPNAIAIFSCGGLDKTKPRFVERFGIPTKTFKDIDWRFIAGAAAFGIAWGASGVCPGPASLRAVARPAWGLVWMTGFYLGGLLGW